MTCQEFVKGVTEEQQYKKIWRSYRKGHTDNEIAHACNVEVAEIRAWRKECKFSEVSRKILIGRVDCIMSDVVERIDSYR